MKFQANNYHPASAKRKTIQELLQELRNPKPYESQKAKILKPELDVELIRSKMKKKWKDPGYCNLEFRKAPILKPKLLNQWEYQRIYQAQRSYKCPKNFKGIKYDQCSREFGQPSTQLLSEGYQKFLSKGLQEQQNQPIKTRQLDEKRNKIMRMMTQTSTRSRRHKTTCRDGFFGYNKTQTASKKLKTLNV